MKERRGQRYVAAVVLGTALSALGASTPATAAAISEDSITNLSRYCTACWRNARLPGDCWGDCTQEVLCRLLQRVKPADWGRLLTRDTEERRELIRAIDAVKKHTQRSARRHVPLTGTVVDAQDAHWQEQRENRQAVTLAAHQVLSSRQRSILDLSRRGHSVAEIAGELRLPAERVSDEKYKAVRSLQRFFRNSDTEA